jgi:hypothetical protein
VDASVSAKAQLDFVVPFSLPADALAFASAGRFGYFLLGKQKKVTGVRGETPKKLFLFACSFHAYSHQGFLLDNTASLTIRF